MQFVHTLYSDSPQPCITSPLSFSTSHILQGHDGGPLSPTMKGSRGLPLKLALWMLRTGAPSSASLSSLALFSSGFSCSSSGTCPPLTPLTNFQPFRGGKSSLSFG